MEKNFILNRRTVLGGAAALGTAGVLAACGSSKDSKATTQGATAGTDAKELYDIAETAVSDLKQGGTLRLSVLHWVRTSTSSAPVLPPTPRLL